MLVATGGALGAILRYILTNISKSLFESSIYGTISVNIVGSFLIGYFISSDLGNNLSEDFIKFFLIIGLLGSFTTFSTFTKEAILFYEQIGIVESLVYIFMTFIICLISTYLSYKFF